MRSCRAAGLGRVGRRTAAARPELRRVAMWLGAMVVLLGWTLVWAAGPLPDLGAGDGAFAQVLGPRVFEFPRDHGPHPGYRQEWWYFTGNLDSGTGERFGFELTFFRYGLVAGEERAGDAAAGVESGARMSAEAGAQSAWRARQIYMGHFAVTDVGRQRFRFAEKVSRGAVGLAGAGSPPLRVWVDDWVLEDVGAQVGAGARVGAGGGGATDGAGARDHGHWKLHAAEEGYELTLDAEALEAPVLNGDRGFSAKSSTPGSASYYYSIPRVAVHGQLVRDAKTLEVHGVAWMDREWGSGSLSREQQGWDWFALQLRDGSSLMFYSLRGHDGRRDPHSAGTWVSTTGEVRPLAADDVLIDVLDYWKNPRGDRYPAKWRVRVPSVGVDVEVRPVVADQELSTASRYWEGAVDVVAVGGGGAAAHKAEEGNADSAAGPRSGGRGYVELVGYAAQ